MRLIFRREPILAAVFLTMLVIGCSDTKPGGGSLVVPASTNNPVPETNLTEGDGIIDDPGERMLKGEPADRFEKQIKPLVAAIAKAQEVVVYEGLPHQYWESDRLAIELKEKRTLKIREFPFYEEPITINQEDSRRMSLLCSELTTFGRYRGPKSCGGYHPDWCVQFQDGDDVYQVLICFGCHEARLYGPKNEVFSDVSDDALKELVAHLSPLQRNRPKHEPAGPVDPFAEPDASTKPGP
jgi:hypothetical protein